MNEVKQVSQSYKIKVSNEAESREAQELFFELGFSWGFGVKEVKATDNKVIHALSSGKNLFGQYVQDTQNYKEITLPELRDLVVLHRNDVNDANWQNEIGDQIYNSSSDKFYIYRSNGWDELQQHEMRQAMWEKSKSIAEPQPDQELISGADALRALADGKEVLYRAINCNSSEWLDNTELLQCSDLLSELYEFRLKPCIIKLNLEIPAPFEPKVGEEYWYLDSHSSRGYNFATFEEDVFDKGLVQFGVWRTEEEVKQVVAALRQIKGASV